MNHVDRNAVPFYAVQHSRKGSAGCDLAVAGEILLRYPMIFLISLAKIGLNFITRKSGSAAPNLAIDNQQSLFIIRAHRHDSRASFLGHSLKNLPVGGLEHGELKGIVEVSIAVHKLMNMRG